MSDTSTPAADFPWFEHYDEGVPHTITVPEASVHSLLDDAAANYGNRPAVVFQNLTLTYSELKDKAETLAASLRKRGVQKGDRVGVMLPNLPQTFIAFWGVLKAGAVAVMTNPLYMESELSHLIHDAGIRHLITLDIFWPKIAALQDSLHLETCYVTRVRDALRFPLSWLQPFSARRSGQWVPVPFDGHKVVAWKDLLATSERLNEPVENPHETLAAIQYTGGTTGIAKGAMLTHANFMANVEQLMVLIQQSAENKHVFLALLPLFHVFGLTITLILPARMAAQVVPIPRYVPADMLESFKKYKFTAFVGAPSVYISLLQQKNLANYDLRHIVFCISGSAPMPVEWLRRFEEVTGTPITEGFGLTEASPVTHANPVYGRQKPGSIGVPMPGTLARIVDVDTGLQTLPPNEIGELVIKGPQVMAGYWQRPKETARTIRDGWLFTGDIAYMDDDGYFNIVDRKKDLIIVGGYNVYPREIDEVLHNHPKIQEAVTVGVSHRSRGETIKAYIVPKAGETLTVPEVVGYCRKQLASFKVPRLIEFREELPKSIVGKVLRRLLRDEDNPVPNLDEQTLATVPDDVPSNDTPPAENTTSVTVSLPDGTPIEQGVVVTQRETLIQNVTEDASLSAKLSEPALNMEKDNSSAKEQTADVACESRATGETTTGGLNANAVASKAAAVACSDSATAPLHASIPCKAH